MNEACFPVVRVIPTRYQVAPTRRHNVPTRHQTAPTTRHKVPTRRHNVLDRCHKAVFCLLSNISTNVPNKTRRY